MFKNITNMPPRSKAPGTGIPSSKPSSSKSPAAFNINHPSLSKRATACGYFAFPSSVYSSAHISIDVLATFPSFAFLTFVAPPPPPEPAPEPDPVDTEEEERERRWKQYLEHQKKTHEERLERERVEAEKGEREWVRLGGVLRDESGKEHPRHAQYEHEMWLEKERKFYKAREVGTKQLLQDTTPLRWGQMPWPVRRKPRSEDDITLRAVEKCIFRPLQFPENTKSRKRILMDHILLWHPDKIRRLLDRVVEEEREDFEETAMKVAQIFNEIKEKIEDGEYDTSSSEEGDK